MDEQKKTPVKKLERTIKTNSASRPKSSSTLRPESTHITKPTPEDPEEVRYMKVRMAKSDFEKLDRGETHSQKGIRDEKGKLRALPDVEPMSEDDLPVRTVVQKREVSFGEKALEAGAEAFGEIIGDVIGTLIGRAVEYTVEKITDPELYRAIGRKSKKFWEEKVKPAFSSTQQHNQEKQAVERAEAQPASTPNVSYAVSIHDEKDQTTFIVSEEQAAILLDSIRAEANDLAEKIFVLSHLTIKSDKSDAERTLEQSYIKELMSEENRRVIELAAAHPEQVGEKVARCLADFQNGYIRTGNKLVKIPGATHSE